MFNFFIPLKFISKEVLILGVLLFIYFVFKKNYNINFYTLFITCFFLIFITHEQGISYDSQLYHLQTIQLNYNYKTIFGIGNLQPHYGMNSSWHSLVSLFNYDFLNTRFIYLVNISLFCFFINEIFKKDFFSKKRISDFFLILSIFYIISYSYFHPYGNGTILNSLGSPEVDTVAMVFFILCVYLFLLFMENKEINHLYLFFSLIFLVITIKISYVGVFLFFIYTVYKNIKNFFLNRIIFFLSFSSFIWFLKSIFLTGCFIFPIKYSCFQTTWSMNSKEVETYGNIIQSFARDTPLRLKFTDFEFMLNSTQWIIPWFKEYFVQTEFLFISFLIILINLLILILIYGLKFFSTNINIQKYHFITLLILLLNLIVWFRAPEIRFGYGSIISLVAISSSMVLLDVKLKFINKIFLYTIFILLIIPITIKNKENFKNITNQSFVRDFNYSTFKVIYTAGNYKVYTPTKNNFCNAFEGLCTYQGYKVDIINKDNHLFMKRN
tara:strand:+ start:1989 stop:3476 length:1488 start_codon:yes stop_codon:yes gene_type:complete